MMSSFDKDVAISVLRKYDPQCQDIIDTCNKVKIYNFDIAKSLWIIQDQCEGAFYLVKRSLLPFYKFVILSKCNKPGSFPSTTDIPISQHYVSQRHTQFYMFKNELGAIQAIMFPNEGDCDRICRKIDNIIKELKSTPEKVAQQRCHGTRDILVDKMTDTRLGEQSYNATPEIESNGDKIINLLESARQRYNEGHVDQSFPATSTPSRSRQININELFTSSNGVFKPMTTHGPVSFAVASTPRSCPPMAALAKSAPTDVKESGNNSLIVSQLEKLFSHGSSVGIIKQDIIEDYEDSDAELLDPNSFVGTGHYRNRTDVVLSKDELREALIDMLKSDDDGGMFLTRLHTTYLQRCHRERSQGK